MAKRLNGNLTMKKLGFNGIFIEICIYIYIIYRKHSESLYPTCNVGVFSKGFFPALKYAFFLMEEI